MNVEKLCSELVKIKSENPSGNTADVAEYIRNYLENIGIKSEITQNPDGHNNVYSKDQSNKLLLSGHIDVVPAIDEGWDIPPYEGRIDETFVHGRGSADMKGGCAAILSAVEKMQNEDGAKVSLAFVCDEESGGKYGIRHLILKKLIHPCDCLLAEPTLPYSPTIGQKGICRYTVEFNGNPGHSSLHPLYGKSAIIQAMDFLKYIDSLYQKKAKFSAEIEEILADTVKCSKNTGLDTEQIFRRIMYNPGIISGGEKSNIIAQKCSLIMDMRIPWEIDVENLLVDIQSNLPPKAVLIKESAANASLTDKNSFLVHTACSAIEKVYGVESKPILQGAASDARALRFAGFNAIEYGPGEFEGMHGLNERVRIEQLNRCVEIYENIIRAYQGTA